MATAKSKANKKSRAGTRGAWPPFDPADQGRAMDEIKILQGIIADQEGNRLKLRNWGISLLSILTVAFLSEDALRIHPLSYFVIAMAFVGLFYLLEIYHAVAEYRAMDRSRAVEDCLRQRRRAYHGPLIGISLIQRFKKGELKKIARLRRIYLPYLVMSSVILLTIVLKTISPPVK